MLITLKTGMTSPLLAGSENKKQHRCRSFNFPLLRNDSDRSFSPVQEERRNRDSLSDVREKRALRASSAQPRHRTHRCTNCARTRRHELQNSADGIALGGFRRPRSIEDRPQESSVKSTRWESSLAGWRVCAGTGRMKRDGESDRERAKERERERERERGGRREG
jgi:hypothetical protein